MSDEFRPHVGHDGTRAYHVVRLTFRDSDEPVDVLISDHERECLEIGRVSYVAVATIRCHAMTDSAGFDLRRLDRLNLEGAR